MPQQQGSDYFESFVSELNSRIADIEEKQAILKDRILLIGRNLVELREKIDESFAEIKLKQEDLGKEQEKLKQALLRIEEELDKKARKDELAIVEKQLKMFNPLKLARIEDVERIVEEKIKHKK